MKAFWMVVLCAVASCSTTPPTPDAATTEPAPKAAAAEPVVATEPMEAVRERPDEAVREPPDMTSGLEGLNTSQAVDLGDGWAAFGVDPKTGSIRAAWYADGKEPVFVDAVATHEDTEWCHDLTAWASTVGPYVAFYVDCMSGEDNITTDSTGYVFRAPFDDQSRPLWSGLVGYENGNQVTGCTDGDNGTLEARGDELWLVTNPWSERMDGYEEEAADFGPCDEPDVLPERQLL